MRTEDEVLALVRSKAAAITQRRRTGRGLVAAVAVAVAAATALGVQTVTRDGGNPGVRVAADGPSTTTGVDVLPNPDPAAPAAPDPAAVAPQDATVLPPPPPAPIRPPEPGRPGTTPFPSVATSTTRPPAPASTTTTALVCRDSREPACGEFRWDPPPAANQLLVASFTTAPSTAVAGERITFEVTWSDGDAPLTRDDFHPDNTDSAVLCDADFRFGPWTPPPPVPGAGTLRYSTTYTAAGMYRVVANLYTGDHCSSPYGDFQKVETTIVVTAPSN